MASGEIVEFNKPFETHRPLARIDVSYYKSKLDVDGWPIPLMDFLHGVKNGQWRQLVEAVRSACTDETRKAAKGRLPAVTPSGTFLRRMSTELDEHSGLLVIDIDDLPDSGQAARTRDLMAADRYCVAAFVSPSGRGVKILLRVGPCADNDAQHAAWQAAVQYLRDEYTLAVSEADPSGKDICRLCFVSHDPDIFIRAGEAEILTQRSFLKPQKKEAAGIRGQSGEGSDVSGEVLRSALCYLDPNAAYPEWLRVCMALKHALPNEDGYSLWAEFCNRAEPHRIGKVRETWDSVKPDGGVTVGTLFGMAEDRGWVNPQGKGYVNLLKARREKEQKPKFEKRPVILPGGPQSYIEASEDIFKRMAAGEDYFIRAGTVCEASDDGLRIVRPDAMQSRIEALGDTFVYVKLRNGEEYALKPRPPTETECKAILASLAAEKHLPPVEIVLAAPMLFLLPDGGIIRADDGYCREAKAFILGRHESHCADPNNAAETLLDLLRDFDFATTDDRARALAMLITPALRMGGFIKDGRCPLLIAEADQSQAGKGTLLIVLATIYHEQPDIIALRDGGVGGFDESLQQRLIAARPLIQLDNLRNKLSSQFLEAVLTAPGPVGCRVPHRGEVPVDPRRFVFLATSNGMEASPDLANRSCIIRLRKRPDDYRYHKWPDGRLLEHLEANKAALLAGVHAIVAAWHNAGAKRADVYGHDFRDWHGIVQEIVSMFWPDAGPVIDAEHKETLRRISDPGRGFIRNVALLMRVPLTLSATEIAELAEENDIPLPYAGAEAGPSERAKAVGRIMARLFRESETLTLDGVTITRIQTEIDREDGRGKHLQKSYHFDPLGCFPIEETSPIDPTGRTTSEGRAYFPESIGSSGDQRGKAIPGTPAMTQEFEF